MNPSPSKCLTPTAMIDSDHEAIVRLAQDTVAGCGSDPSVRAVHLYYVVRDPIRYTPYYPFFRPEHYRASSVLKSGWGYCVRNSMVWYAGSYRFLVRGRRRARLCAS